MKILLFISVLFLATCEPVFADPLLLPNLSKNATGTTSGGKSALDVNISSGSITATNTANGATGSAVPAQATYIGGILGGNLTGLKFGQQTMANSLACNLASDQSALAVTGTFWQATQPVSGTFWQATQPVSGTFFQATQPVSATSLPLPTGAATETTLSTLSGKVPSNLTVTSTRLLVDPSGVTSPVSAAALPLPSGAATSALQSTINTTLGSPFQAGGSLGAGSAIIGKVGIDQTTPGTTNLVSIGTNGTVQIKAALNSTGSGSAAGATVSTVATLSAPASAIGFILMNLDTSTTNMRWAVGRTASTTLGQQLQPGRDTGFVPIGANISIIAESGTVNYDVQWISQ